MNKKLYTVKSVCYVCGTAYLSRYNIKRPRVCTPPTHSCQRGKRAGKKVSCVDRCCRSKYQRGAQASAMDSAIDRRKLLSKAEYAAAIRHSFDIPKAAGIAIRFLANTGCRLGEAMLIRPCDFDWQDGKFSIVRIRTLKRAGHPQRQVHLKNSAAFTKELRRYAQGEGFSVAAHGGDNPLFSIPRRSLQGWISKLLKKIKPDRVSGAHIFRHCRASQLVAAGAPFSYIAQQLGWASLDMIKVYAHTDEREIDKIFGKL